MSRLCSRQLSSPPLILEEILRCSRSGFKTALEHGWIGLWEYGELHAKAANVPDAVMPDAAYCLLMNLASVSQDAPKELQR